jgi:hypothetical protein
MNLLAYRPRRTRKALCECIRGRPQALRMSAPPSPHAHERPEPPPAALFIWRRDFRKCRHSRDARAVLRRGKTFLNFAGTYTDSRPPDDREKFSGGDRAGSSPSGGHACGIWASGAGERCGAGRRSGCRLPGAYREGAAIGRVPCIADSGTEPFRPLGYASQPPLCNSNAREIPR